MPGNITLDLIRWAEKTPDAPALLFGNESISYRQLDQTVWKLAQHLYDHGIRRQQVVALTIGNEILLAVTLLAVARLGAAGISLARSMGAQERLAAAHQAGICWLLTDHETAAMNDVATIRLASEPAAWNATRVRYGILEESPVAPWQIIRGSGTTGEPRLLPISHDQAAARFRGQALASSITPGDRLAGLSGLEFSISKHRLGWALMAGAAYAILDHANPLDDISRLGVSLLGISVMHAEQMLSKPDSTARRALEGVRGIWSAGSVVSNDLRTRIRSQLSENLWIDYGSNEAGHLTLARPPDVFDTPGTVGRSLPGSRTAGRRCRRPAPVCRPSRPCPRARRRHDRRLPR
ncbi:long-chain fatty acid--CoA ligase [Quatrionicoccus australiensis]|uniref:long-chain fatty acid--CoA ligase n=1 Tax=Quatrionicoccus australiensis TaxID=138118 RepID=UPI0021F63690|nr:long-chain fatty acid--CoA ligase [Quatrionicoccus australiensis]